MTSFRQIAIGRVAVESNRGFTVGVTAFLLVMSVFGDSTAAQQNSAGNASDLAAVPVCANNKGEQVQFSDTDRGRPGLAAGMATMQVAIQAEFG